jgi:ectoine hydroxylase-related dioxygenase (phytanoyl-CoA dioxygenase family)
MSQADLDNRCLDEQGYVVLEDFMTTQLLADLRRRVEELFAEEGVQAGNEFKQELGCRRLANLVDKGEVFRAMIAMPQLLKHVGHVLGNDFKLSSLNARSVNPGGDGAQPLHVDMAAIPDKRGFWVCNSVWMLDDFTPANGSLLVVPGSHRWRRLPGPAEANVEGILVTGGAGTVVVINAHLWHAGTANHTALPRTAVHAFYCRRDKPQQQHQKKLLRPEVQQRLSAPLRELLALDDEGNDRLSAEVAVRSGFLK